MMRGRVNNKRHAMALLFPEFTRFYRKGQTMPKVDLVCDACHTGFAVWPSFIANAERRGSKVRFCSVACSAAGRRAGIVASRGKTGQFKACEVCRNDFWVKASKANRRFCSEACRQEAFRQGIARADRGEPRPIRLRGADISCKFCGEVVYRKASMIARNIAITCGKRECVSAHGRALWGLGPQAPELIGVRGPRRRKTNFTAMQRAQWLESQCVRCGSGSNLALDHVIPVCAGGQSVRANAQTLCQPCNNWKAKHVDRLLSRQQAQSGGCKS